MEKPGNLNPKLKAGETYNVVALVGPLLLNTKHKKKSM